MLYTNNQGYGTANQNALKWHNWPSEVIEKLCNWFRVKGNNGRQAREKNRRQAQENNLCQAREKQTKFCILLLENKTSLSLLVASKEYDLGDMLLRREMTVRIFVLRDRLLSVTVRLLYTNIFNDNHLMQTKYCWNVLTGPRRLLPFTNAVDTVSFSMLGSPWGCVTPFLMSRIYISSKENKTMSQHSQRLNQKACLIKSRVSTTTLFCLHYSPGRTSWFNWVCWTAKLPCHSFSANKCYKDSKTKHTKTRHTQTPKKPAGGKNKGTCVPDQGSRGWPQNVSLCMLNVTNFKLLSRWAMCTSNSPPSLCLLWLLFPISFRVPFNLRLFTFWVS